MQRLFKFSDTAGLVGGNTACLGVRSQMRWFKGKGNVSEIAPIFRSPAELECLKVYEELV